MTLKEIQKQLPPKTGLLLTGKANIKYLAGFHGSNGQLLITNNSAFLLTDFRYTGLAKKNLPKEIKIFEVEKKSLNGISAIAEKQKLSSIFY